MITHIKTRAGALWFLAEAMRDHCMEAHPSKRDVLRWSEQLKALAASDPMQAVGEIVPLNERSEGTP